MFSAAGIGVSSPAPLAPRVLTHPPDRAGGLSVPSSRLEGLGEGWPPTPAKEASFSRSTPSCKGRGRVVTWAFSVLMFWRFRLRGLVFGNCRLSIEGFADLRLWVWRF